MLELGCNLVGTVLEVCWNLAGTVLEMCWTWAGTVLELGWNCAGLELSCNTGGIYVGTELEHGLERGAQRLGI